jgi:diguanylate cyclase
MSFGICMASDAAGPDDLYAKADRALYRSKVGGRNRVTMHVPSGAQRSKDWMLYKRD